MSGAGPIIAGFVALGVLSIAVVVFIIRSAIRESNNRAARHVKAAGSDSTAATQIGSEE